MAENSRAVPMGDRPLATNSDSSLVTSRTDYSLLAAPRPHNGGPDAIAKSVP